MGGAIWVQHFALRPGRCQKGREPHSTAGVLPKVEAEPEADPRHRSVTSILSLHCLLAASPPEQGPLL